MNLAHVAAQAKVSSMLRSSCKCKSGDCWQQFRSTEADVVEFLNQFENRKKNPSKTLCYIWPWGINLVAAPGQRLGKRTPFWESL